MAALYDKFETETIKILEYGSRNKKSKVLCMICSFQWDIMAKRIKSSSCLKCQYKKKLRKCSREEFIEFSNKDEEMNYEKGIFTYKCIVCNKISSKMLEEIAKDGPCIPTCIGNYERAKMLCNKTGMEYTGPELKYRLKKRDEEVSDNCPEYTIGEIIVMMRKEKFHRGELCKDIKPPILL